MTPESLCHDTVRRYTMKAVENHCISSLLVNDGYINIYTWINRSRKKTPDSFLH